MSHTYAILEVSPLAWSEIWKALFQAGYNHAFDGSVIDMHGIALEPKDEDNGNLRVIHPLVQCAVRERIKKFSDEVWEYADSMKALSDESASSACAAIEMFYVE